MRLLILFIVLLIMPLGAATAFFHGGGVASITNENVTVNLSSTSNTIPANFVGISIEEKDVTDSGLMQGTGTSIGGILKLLGPNGFIRIGANAQDSPNPSYNVNPSCVTGPVLTPTIANNVASFAHDLGNGWTVSWGLNLLVNNSTTANTYAGYILSAFSGIPNPIMLSFGNEPDVYEADPTAYATLWNSYYSPIHASHPTAAIEAGELALPALVTTWLAGLTPGLSGLTLATSHYYIDANVGPDYQRIITDSSQTMTYASEIAYAGSKFRLDECGTSYTVGTNAVENALVTTGWYLNTAITLAKGGTAGVSPHEALTQPSLYCSNYNSIPFYNDFIATAGGYTPTPRFYGIYLFSKIAGQTIAATTNAGAGTINSIATVGTGGNANIIVTNNDVSHSISITPAQSAAWSTATVLLVASGSGLGCADTTATLNGVSIGESGVITSPTITINKGDHITLQPCGSALIQIQP